jgi:predicted nucleic acid-binding protein
MAKNKIVCDTDVMIDYWDISSKRHIQTKTILEEKIGLDNIYLSAITKMELLMGARNKSEETTISKRLNRFNIVLLDNAITIEALHLFENYRLSHGIAIPDCLIASTTKVLDAELFTYNIKDFKFISKLKLFDISAT